MLDKKSRNLVGKTKNIGSGEKWTGMGKRRHIEDDSEGRFECRVQTREEKFVRSTRENRKAVENMGVNKSVVEKFAVRNRKVEIFSKTEREKISMNFGKERGNVKFMGKGLIQGEAKKRKLRDKFDRLIIIHNRRKMT